MTKEPKIGIAYARVSTANRRTTNNDEKTQSNDRQIEEIDNYCSRNNIKIVQIFTDEKSGKYSSKERPGIKALLEYIEIEHTDAVVTYEISRLGRSFLDLAQTVDILKTKKISLHCIRDGVVTIDQDGKLNKMAEIYINLMSTFVSLEREAIVERSRSGLEYSVLEKNRYTGGALLPYGYQRNKDKQLEINIPESLVVKKIFQLCLDGLGTSLIAQQLNKDEDKTRYHLSLKNPVKINHNTKDPSSFRFRDGTIHGILTNTIYKGERRYKDITVPAPIIIEPEIFDKVQALLKQRYNKKSSETVHFHLLKFIDLECGVCHKGYFPHKRTPKDPNKVSKDDRFVCSSKRYKESTCDNYGIGTSKLYSGLWWSLRRTKELIENIQKGIDNSEVQKEINNRKKELSILELNLNKEENFKEELFDMRKAGVMEKEEFMKKAKSSALIIKGIQDKIKNVRSIIINHEENKKKQLNFNTALLEIKSNKVLMRKIITDLVKRVIFHPIKNIVLSNYKGDKTVLIEFYLKMSPDPIFFVISQRDWFIIDVKKDEIDFENHIIDEKIYERKDIIQLEINPVKMDKEEETNKNEENELSK